MKTFIFSCCCLAIGLGAYAQQTIIDANAVERSIGSFHAIDASAGVEVLISAGTEEKLAVSVPDPEYLDNIITEVKDGVLKIYPETDWQVWKTTKNFKVKVYVSFKYLDMIKATSGASVKGNVALENLNARQNSGGMVVLKGTVNKLDVNSSSGGMFKGYDLVVTHMLAKASSGGGVQVTVTQEVTAEASSGGFVNYKGSAVIRDIKVNSGGMVKSVKD